MGFKSFIRAFTAISLLLLLTACATQVTTPTETSDFKVRALQHVTVEYGAEMKTIGSADKLFDIEALHTTLEDKLAQHQLMAPNGDFDLKVVITEVQMRSTASAVLLGIFAGDDHVIGDAVVLDRNGEPVYTYTAKASYALGGVAGSSEGRLDWLYNEFSTLVSDELAARRAEAPISQQTAAGSTVVETDALIGTWRGRMLEGGKWSKEIELVIESKAGLRYTGHVVNVINAFAIECNNAEISLQKGDDQEFLISFKRKGVCEGTGTLVFNKGATMSLEGEVNWSGRGSGTGSLNLTKL